MTKGQDKRINILQTFLCPIFTFNDRDNPNSYYLMRKIADVNQCKVGKRINNNLQMLTCKQVVEFFNEHKNNMNICLSFIQLNYTIYS